VGNKELVQEVLDWMISCEHEKSGRIS